MANTCNYRDLRNSWDGNRVRNIPTEIYIKDPVRIQNQTFLNTGTSQLPCRNWPWAGKLHKQHYTEPNFNRFSLTLTLYWVQICVFIIHACVPLQLMLQHTSNQTATTSIVHVGVPIAKLLNCSSTFFPYLLEHSSYRRPSTISQRNGELQHILHRVMTTSSKKSQISDYDCSPKHRFQNVLSVSHVYICNP